MSIEWSAAEELASRMIIECQSVAWGISRNDHRMNESIAEELVEMIIEWMNQ